MFFLCSGMFESRNGPNFYHQYAQLDFTVLDKRLGTLEDLRRLVKDAHALDMYVIIDVVRGLEPAISLKNGM